jgi:hypothetical protein
MSEKITLPQLLESLKTLCESIERNDKTQYTYHGKSKLRPDGSEPGKGQRFLTPRELAKMAWGEIYLFESQEAELS